MKQFVFNQQINAQLAGKMVSPVKMAVNIPEKRYFHFRKRLWWIALTPARATPIARPLSLVLKQLLATSKWLKVPKSADSFI